MDINITILPLCYSMVPFVSFRLVASAVSATFPPAHPRPREEFLLDRYDSVMVPSFFGGSLQREGAMTTTPSAGCSCLTPVPSLAPRLPTYPPSAVLPPSPFFFFFLHQLTHSFCQQALQRHIVPTLAHCHSLNGFVLTNIHSLSSDCPLCPLLDAL